MDQVEITQYIVNVLQRQPFPGEVESYQAIIDNNAATLNDVLLTIINSSEAVNEVYPMVLTYQAIYGRVPDTGGLDFWTNVYRSVLSLDNPDTTTVNEALVEVLKTFVDPAQTPEFTERYGPNPTGDQFVAASYQNVLNRLPDQAGLNYWQQRYAEVEASYANSGMTQEEITVQTRAEILEQFVSSTEYEVAAGDEIDNYLTDLALGVETNNQPLWSFGNDGDFTLTVDTDSGPAFTGGGQDDVFSAKLGLGIDGLVGVQTLQGPDVLDGGAGFNILNAELNNTGTTSNPTISNIQQYNLTSFAGPLFGHGNLDLSRATGYEQLWNRDSRVDLTLDNVGEVAILGMDNVRDGSSYEVNYDNIAVETQVVVVDRSGADGNRVELEINGVLNGDITNLELNVSNGVYLYLDNNAADIDNLIINGSGPLDLVGEDDFRFLKSLDSTGYDEGLILDISGSDILESVLTGDGDDEITASIDNFVAGTPPTTVDLGLGDNTLILIDDDGNGRIDSAELSALDFTLAPVMNVQTLELDDVRLGADASLALEGVGGLETLELKDFRDNGGHDLSISGGPQVLTINATADSDPNDADFDMNGGVLTVDTVVNLTMNAGDDLRVDGGLEGDALETVVLNAEDDVVLYATQGLDALTSLEVNALGTAFNTAGASDADVDLILATASDLGALNNVKVSGANNASLTMTGIAGTVFVAGVKQVEQFVVDVSAANNAATSAGDIIFTSGDLGAGFVATNYSSNNLGFQGRDANAAQDVASDLDGTAELNASSPFFSNTVTVEWDSFGAKDQLNVLSAVASSGGISSPGLGDTTLVTLGADQIEMAAGQGFEALQTVTVDALDGDANVDLDDVYGAFTLNVTATDYANVDLFNTGATSVTVTAGMDATEEAFVRIGGDTVGAPSLVSLTLSGDEGDVVLSGNLGSFTTLDASGVVTDLFADTSGAVFQVGPGGFVAYSIGDTATVNFTGNDIREVYDFSEANIGNVTITDFTIGADPIAGDRLDLSAFASSAAELIFTDMGADLVITDLAGGTGDFSGSITIVGGGGLGEPGDMAAFNIIYA